MAGVDFGFAGEEDQFFHYRTDLGVVVSAGEVGAAYAAGEEGVAGEEDVFVFVVVADAVWCMARGGDYLETV